MQRAITVGGVGMTRFESAADAHLRTLLERAATRALDDASVPASDLDGVFVGNMAARRSSAPPASTTRWWRASARTGPPPTA